MAPFRPGHDIAPSRSIRVVGLQPGTSVPLLNFVGRYWVGCAALLSPARTAAMRPTASSL